MKEGWDTIVTLLEFSVTLRTMVNSSGVIGI